jgi:hypothetical protein
MCFYFHCEGRGVVSNPFCNYSLHRPRTRVTNSPHPLHSFVWNIFLLKEVFSYHASTLLSPVFRLLYLLYNCTISNRSNWAEESRSCLMAVVRIIFKRRIDVSVCVLCKECNGDVVNLLSAEITQRISMKFGSDGLTDYWTLTTVEW